jgi:hypothetical protein
VKQRPEALTEDQIHRVVQSAIEEAVSFIESEIAPDRIKAQRYYSGQTDLGHEDGRSKVVATKIRDTVRAIKPSLLRVFLNTDRPVEFVPVGPEDAMAAEQATKYMHVKFQQCDGYRHLTNAFHDALVKKTGIVKAYWDEREEVTHHTYSNLSDDELALIVGEAEEDELEIVSIETQSELVEIQDPTTGQPGEAPAGIHALTIKRTTETGGIRIDSVPPEEFFVDRHAKSLNDSFVVGHSTEKRIGDLVDMGYAFEDVIDYAGTSEASKVSDEEEFARRAYSTLDSSNDQLEDPSLRPILVTEAYMRVDVDGTGSPMLHRFLCLGDKYHLLDYEPWGCYPFAVFECDPEPHAFFGSSIADILIQEQDAATSMLRGLLDNVALTNNPRTEVVEENVNMDDVLNNEIGGIVRTTQPGSIAPLTVPFMAGQTLAAVQYFDMLVEEKSGVTKASTGLSPDALQSTTATAVAATVAAQAGQIEVMARHLAEGGMKQLFRLMLRLCVENTPRQEMLRMYGDKFVPLDPRTWSLNMDVSVNVGLGTGREDQKQSAMMQTLQIQQSIFQAYGPGNGLVTLTNLRNTLADSLAMNGIRNADRYFQPMDPQTEQQLIASQQQASQQPPPPDPQTQAFLQVEQMKLQQKSQSEMAKLQLQQQGDMAKMQMQATQSAVEDDRERDRMDMDLVLRAADLLGKYGVAVDQNRIRYLQAAPRGPEGI